MFSEVRHFKPLEMRIVFLFYALLAILAVIWDWGSRGNPIYAWSTSSLPSGAQILGASLAVVVYFATVRVLCRFVEAFRALETLFIQLLTPISYFQIFAVSAVSAVVEEWLFRGIFVPHFGIMLSSVVFGLCHLIPAPKLWMWWISSTILGIILAQLYLSTQNLWLCTYIHFAINFLGLWSVNLRAYSTPRFSRAKA